MRRFLRPSLDWLLVFVPVALAVDHFAPQQHIFVFFSAARSQPTMLILAAIALTMPAAYHHVAGFRGRPLEGRLSLAISIVLLAVYACSLLFSLRTHKQLFDGGSGEEGEGKKDDKPEPAPPTSPAW